MAERIVSPGVFTRERDLSFLPQGIAEIGAAIVGPTIKGPAFVPTMISSFSEFEEMFGSTTKDFYTPYAVEQYLRSAGQVTIVRVLNTGGYSADFVQVNITASVASGSEQAAASGSVGFVLAPSRGGTNGTVRLEECTVTSNPTLHAGDYESFTLNVSGSTLAGRNYPLSFNTSSANFYENVFSKDPQVQKSGLNTVGVYLYKSFKHNVSNLRTLYNYSTLASTTASVATGTHSAVDFTSATFNNASTPNIQ